MNIDEEDPKVSVRKCLSSEDTGKWLLIVDNADDPEILFEPPDSMHEYLPESETGLAIFTTRSGEVGQWVAGSDIIELHEMDIKDAEIFLDNSLIRKKLLRDRAITMELLRELTYLPLAIAQAAAYLNRNHSTIQKYLEILRSTEQELVSLMSREFRDSTRYRGSQNAVATTWIVSFDQIRKSDNAAADLLSFISCIEPKAIPRSLLPRLTSEEEMTHAIGTLLSYAYLIPREDNETYDMHNLVHLATWIWIRKQERIEEITTKALWHLKAVFPSTDRANRQVWQNYTPHAFRLLYRSKAYETNERFDLFFQVGLCLGRNRRFKDAINCLEEVFEWRKVHFLEEETERLTSEHELARAYFEDRRIKEAIEIFEHVVKVGRKTLKEEDHKQLTSEHELARAYFEDRRIKEAIEILEHVVEVEEKTLEEEDHSRLKSEHALVSAYLEDTRIKEAIGIFEHVVKVRRKTLEEKDHARLTSEHELASAYFKDKQVKNAIEIFEHKVEIRKQTLEEEDHARLTSERELARAYLEDN
ncbi:hypothetical protein B0O99DRAFT_741246 [Bisporella sp. PMI_857]|nr:hypothetical protein B0O99DRAFT_741246 [Bisporella sp. PMI_857]